LALFLGGVCVAWWQRERIRKVYYSLKFPELLLTLNIIYPSGFFRKFWRLIPSDKGFILDGKLYLYNEAAIIKNNDWFSYKDSKGNLVCRIENKEYNLNMILGIKQRWERWPELYYKEGNPIPIDFTGSSPAGLAFNSTDVQRMRKSDTLAKIHNLMARADLMPIILVLVGVVLLAVLAIAFKTFGMIK
jgi:hypothetical protein